MNKSEKKPIEPLTKQERESALRKLEERVIAALNNAAQQAKKEKRESATREIISTAKAALTKAAQKAKK